MAPLSSSRTLNLRRWWHLPPVRETDENLRHIYDTYGENGEEEDEKTSCDGVGILSLKYGEKGEEQDGKNDVDNGREDVVVNGDGLEVFDDFGFHMKKSISETHLQPTFEPILKPMKVCNLSSNVQPFYEPTVQNQTQPSSPIYVKSSSEILQQLMGCSIRPCTKDKEVVPVHYNQSENAPNEPVKSRSVLLQQLQSQQARERKGKAIATDDPCIKHKSVRFTQGTAIFESVPLSEDEQDIPQTQGDGDQLDEDILFGMDADYFDNDQLEEDIRLQRAYDDYIAQEDWISHLEDDPQLDKDPGEPNKKQKKTLVNLTTLSSDESCDEKDVLDDEDAYNDDLASIHSTSDEERVDDANDDLDVEKVLMNTGIKKVRFNRVDMENPTLKVGLVFRSKAEVRECVTWYAMVNKKPLRQYCSDKKRLYFKCTYPCKWSVWFGRSKMWSVRMVAHCLGSGGAGECQHMEMVFELVATRSLYL